jgi:ketosteroid isomerase-like protein
MKTCFTFLISLLILASCTTQPQYPTPEEAEAAVIAKEVQALANWSAGNPAGYPVNFADDATYFDDIGAFTLLKGIEECNAYAASLEGMIPPHDYEMVDTHVQSYGDIAILTFQYHGSVDGEKGQPWKASLVYKYADGDWSVVHGHWSLVKVEPPAEDPAEAPAEE